MCGGDFYEGKFLQDKILMLVCKWLLLVAQKREREREREKERERERERKRERERNRDTDVIN